MENPDYRKELLQKILQSTAETRMMVEETRMMAEKTAIQAKEYTQESKERMQQTQELYEQLIALQTKASGPFWKNFANN